MKTKLKKSVLEDRARCYGHENARNAEDGATVEKKQLSEDLYYKKRTISFIYFNWKTNVKNIQTRISLIIINSYYIGINKNEVELSQILYIIVYVQITLIRQLIRKKTCENI
jgi:hypothetical protein